VTSCGSLPIQRLLAVSCRNNPVGVIGGGDAAMEEASFLSRYASKVYIIHRFDYLEASKVMQRRVLSNPKIEVRQWRSSLAPGHVNISTSTSWHHRVHGTSADQ